MNQQEATNLVRIVKAACPAQAVDEFTADAWQFILDDIPLADAMAAVRTLARRESDKPLWIDPRQVLTEVRRIRARRLDDFDVATLTGAPADVDDYIAWRRATNRAIADGHQSGLPQIEPGKHQVSADFIRELRARSRGQLPGKDIP